MPRSMNKTLEETRPDWAILEEWSGISLGDPVKITGETGTFRFVNHVTTASEKVWVTVLGPVGKHQKYRSFRPDRVKAARVRRTRQ